MTHPRPPTAQSADARTRIGESEEDYWCRRERAARDLAARATDPGIARIHLELAARYAARVLDCRS